MIAEHPEAPGVPVIDARGTRCPTPVIRLARAAKGRAAGTVVVLLADDVAARSDVPAWGRLKGHAVSTDEAQAWTAYRVVLGPSGAEGTAAAQERRST